MGNYASKIILVTYCHQLFHNFWVTLSCCEFPPEQDVTRKSLQQGNILLWHSEKLHRTIFLQKEGYPMLKTGLIKQIRLCSLLFHSLSLWPEASGLTSVYLLAMTKMSIITFFSLYFFSLPCLWVFSIKVCFFHFDFSRAKVPTLQQNYPCTYCCTHWRQPAALGKAPTPTNLQKHCVVYK